MPSFTLPAPLSLRSLSRSLPSLPLLPPLAPSSSRWASTTPLGLGDLAPNKGATRDSVRLGRGWSSTKGGTSGRGHKGQNARAGNGKPKAGFEGGQTSLARRFPKRGEVNFARKEYAPLSIAKLQEWVAQDRIDPNQPIDVGTIFRSNVVHGLKGWSGVKLLGDLDPSLPLPPLSLRLSRYSRSAAAAILAAGGEVTAVYHNALALRQQVYPEKFVGREVQEAKPIRKTDILYYTNPQKFGYLAKREETVVPGVSGDDVGAVDTSKPDAEGPNVVA